MNNTSAAAVNSTYYSYQQCSRCATWHIGYHVCGGTAGAGIGWTVVPPVTAEDIRRIVREELAAALAKPKRTRK